MIGRVRELGKAPGIIVHFGSERVPWMVRASLMNSEENAVFLVQLMRAGLTAIGRRRDEFADLDRLVEGLPDGLVVIDRDLVVRWANRAFLDLVQVGSDGGVLGQRLDRWMNRPGADLRVLLANLRRNGSVRLFATTLQGQFGTVADVEISASGDLEQAPHHVCVMARDVGRRLSTAQSTRADILNGSAALQAGTTSLRDLVRDAVRVVERHYIEETLDMVEGNRTAAAELLGLSRQSLYTKLNRHGIEASASALQEDGD
jgi:transcriptional regulator PpsR